MSVKHFVSSFDSVSFLFSIFLISSPISVLTFALPSPNGYGGTTWINNIQSLQSWTPRSADTGEITVRPILLTNNISYGGENLRFGCGFFCYSIPCHKGYSFAVFFVIYETNYSDPDDLQMVWTANRERLVQDNATLELTSTGNIVLKDSDGTLVWSTNTSTHAFQAMVMEETGNLNLLNTSNETLWQSFDHPTDVLLQGQKLKVGQKLTANTSPTNTCQGIFYATLLVNGFALYTAPAPPQMYFRYPSLPTTLNVAYMQFDNELVSYYPKDFPSNPIALNGTIPINSLYFQIDSYGHVLFYSFEKKTKGSLDDYLSKFRSALRICDYPTTCGDYGICFDGQCVGCPKEGNAFTQIDASKPNLGCLLRSPLICPEKPTMSSRKNHHFLELYHVSYFSYNLGNASIQGLSSGEECKALCLKNCSCKAAFFRYDVSDDHSIPSCYLESNVYSLKMNTPSDAFYNSTAYIKFQRNPKNTKRRVINISVSVVCGMVIMFLVSWILITRSRKSKQKQSGDESENDDEDDPLSLQTRLPLRFSFKELKDATNGFSLKLGSGGFGSVYEGSLRDGTKIAVKRLDRAGQGAKEFKAEVGTLGNIHHLNLVRLVGFCADKSHRMLVYEFLPNGSLEKWVFSKSDIHHHFLDIKTRSKVALHIAQGLTYLHEQCQQRIIHLDIKPQNILLDGNFNAKVADFGLAKLIEGEQSEVITMTRGTPGYMAPELLRHQHVSVKADVFSFGIMLVEIVCGKRSREISDGPLFSVLRILGEEGRLSEMIDPVLEDEAMEVKEEAVKMLRVGMLCIQDDFTSRPTMSIVVKALEGTIELPSASKRPSEHPFPSTTKPDGLELSYTPLSSVLSGR